MARMPGMIIHHPLTVGMLRELIKNLPDEMPIVNDVIESVSDCVTAGIVSVESETPENWRDVEKIPALWFHLRIRNMDDAEDDD